MAELRVRLNGETIVREARGAFPTGPDSLGNHILKFWIDTPFAPGRYELGVMLCDQCGAALSERKPDKRGRWAADYAAFDTDFAGC